MHSVRIRGRFQKGKGKNTQLGRKDLKKKRESGRRYHGLRGNELPLRGKREVSGLRKTLSPKKNEKKEINMQKLGRRPGKII